MLDRFQECNKNNKRSRDLSVGETQVSKCLSLAWGNGEEGAMDGNSLKHLRSAWPATGYSSGVESDETDRKPVSDSRKCFLKKLQSNSLGLRCF